MIDFENPHLYMPHSGNMVLLDRIEKCDEQEIIAFSQISAEHVFLDAQNQFPAYMGIEIMAQAIAVWSGIHAVSNGDKVRLGFLLGSRKINILRSKINLDDKLRIVAKLSFRDDIGMAVFDCSLSCINATEELEIISARLNVFSPNSDTELAKIKERS